MRAPVLDYTSLCARRSTVYAKIRSPMTPIASPLPTAQAVRSAVQFLARVTPRGDHEADELIRTIETLKRLSSTPVQHR